MILNIPLRLSRNKHKSILNKLKYKYLFSITLMFTSCSKSDCNCTNPWDINTTYFEDDLVSHNQKCWIAIAQGKGIEPGPWLYNGNDIWVECID